MSITALVTDYQPRPATDAPDLQDWTWWWEHTRWRIPRSMLNNLRMFPCRIGDKPAFLCDFDVSDRQQIHWIRRALARYIPEHASDIVFYQSSRPWAGKAIRRGLSFLYSVEPGSAPKDEAPAAPTLCDGCGDAAPRLVAIGAKRVCETCLDALCDGRPTSLDTEHGDCQSCGAPGEASVGEVTACGSCVDRVVLLAAAE